MEENQRPDVFNSNNSPQQGQPPLSEAEKQMIANRERELAERGMSKPLNENMEMQSYAKPAENTVKPMIPGSDAKPPITEPDFGSDFDLVPIPSQGKTYGNNKKSIKISFLNASDENILTNPNLLKSGKYLEVLFTRKILETDIKFRDLLIGDRNAIMIWLRATGFGTDYPIQVMDPSTYEEISTEIDLEQLKTKKLELDPDDEGYFDYTFPLSKKQIKFKFLTVGDAEDIEEHAEKLGKSDNQNYDLATYTLQKQIVEVEGKRDSQTINDFVRTLRMGDSRAFKKYVNDNECGIDLNITVTTPGGGRINTFFPLNTRFFWPEL